MAAKGKKETQRKLTAILSADVHGYSCLMGRMKRRLSKS